MAIDGTLGGVYRRGGEGEEPCVEVWYGGRFITSLKPSRSPTGDYVDRGYVANETVANTLSEIFKWWKLSGVKEKVEAEKIVKEAIEQEPIDNRAIKAAAETEKVTTARRLVEAYKDSKNFTGISYAETMDNIAQVWRSDGAVAGILKATSYMHAEDENVPLGTVERAIAATQASAGRGWLRQREPLLHRAIAQGGAEIRIKIIQALVGGVE